MYGHFRTEYFEDAPEDTTDEDTVDERLALAEERAEDEAFDDLRDEEDA